MKIALTLLGLTLSSASLAADWQKVDDYCWIYDRSQIDASYEWQCDYNRDGVRDAYFRKNFDGEYIQSMDTNYDGKFDFTYTTYTVGQNVVMSIYENLASRALTLRQGENVTHHIYDEDGDGFMDSLSVPGRNLSADRTAYPQLDQFRKSWGLRCDAQIQNNYYQQALAIRNKQTDPFYRKMYDRIQLVEQQVQSVCKQLFSAGRQSN